jgi:hypothetical protein
MSSIDILSGEWRIEFDDEKATATPTVGLKKITHISGTGVVTANALYSAVADAMDELLSMDDENPMLPTTPNAYTLENGYFMDNLSTNFVSGGAISSVDWANQIWCKVVTGGTPFEIGDIGRQVLEVASTDTGILLDFETLPDGTDVIWVRGETAGDVFDSTSGLIHVTGDGGAGTRTCSVVATTGEQLWSNVNVIGGIDGWGANTAEVYVVQNRIKLTQWWTTDPTASGGIIDILVRANDSLAAAFPVIALGIAEVFNRRYGSLYDNFALDISAGGTNSLPLATGPDLNNTTGYWASDWASGTGTAMLVGDLLTDTTNAGRFGICTAVVDSGATGTFEWFLVGDLVNFTNGDGITSSDEAGNNRVCVLNNVPAAATDGPTDVTGGAGGTVTVEYGINDVDHDGDGNTEPYSVTVDAQGNVSTEEVYERMKYITRRGADASDLFTTLQTTENGETFRGLQMQAQTGAVGTFTEGDDISNFTEATGIQAGIVLGVNSSETYVTLTDTSGAFTTADDLRDESADSVIISGTPDVISPVKAAPFGSLAGGIIFGSRGIVYINPASGDAQDARLTDDNGVPRNPPNTVSVEITNLVDQDVVFVADDTGSAGVIDKDRFTGIAAASVRDTIITVQGTIDGDVPAVGFVRVVDTVVPNVEHRYRYASRTSTVFTLVQYTGTDTGGSTTQIIDAGGGFDAKDIIFGDRCYNVDDTELATVISQDNDTTITTTTVVGWGSDEYDIGRINIVYTTADNLYAPILDRRVEAADSDTISNSLVQTSSFGIIVNVRQGKIILPFTQNTTVEASGRSLSTIRTDDTIAN